MRSSRSTRLYAASIAIVSGVYAIGSAAPGMMRSPMMGQVDAGVGIGGSVMFALGVVVLLHGILLLTPGADRLGGRSAPLMLVWGALMLLNQAFTATMPGWAMGIGMGWDPGMVAIAVLMLASGLIMRDEARA